MLRKPPIPEQTYKAIPRNPLNIITREEWGAAPPTKEEDFQEYPPFYIVMGYTETEPCKTKEECIKTMQELQKKHMDEGMSDIRYSYVIGYDNNVYEGRGWKKKAGVHNRYSELKGENVEIAITAKRGKLPDANISALMWQVQDQGIWDGLLPAKMQYFQDYEDPSPEVTELTGVDAEEGISVTYDWSKHDEEFGY